MTTDRVSADPREGAGYVIPERDPAHADPDWFETGKDENLNDPDGPFIDPLPTPRHRRATLTGSSGVSGTIEEAPPTTDADADAFLAAAGITDPTQAAAIDALVVALKADGLWSKMDGIYPFVGGTAGTHKWNLKDPRDLNAAFRLTFTGAGTHSANGYQPAGVGHADTHFIPTSNLPANQSHQSYYSRTNTGGAYYDMGTYEGGAIRQHLALFYSGGVFWNGQNDNAGSNVTVPRGDGLFVGSRIDASVTSAYRNGALLLANASTYTGQSTLPIFIGALNYFGGPFQNTVRECAFASFGEGLTDAENADLYTAVQTYQTSLGRNV